MPVAERFPRSTFEIAEGPLLVYQEGWFCR